MRNIKSVLLRILPEERHLRIPCVVFGSAILLLMVANVWKWVVR